MASDILTVVLTLLLCTASFFAETDFEFKNNRLKFKREERHDKNN